MIGRADRPDRSLLIIWPALSRRAGGVTSPARAGIISRVRQWIQDAQAGGPA